MKTVIKKYVYQIEPLDSYQGLTPLRDYVSMSYFNYGGNQGTYISLDELSIFLTQSLFEFFTRENININDIDIRHEYFFIGFFIAHYPERKEYKVIKSLYFKYKNKLIIISENSKSMASLEPLKTASFEKDALVNLVLLVHNISLLMINEIVQICNSSKKLRVVKKDNDEIDLEEEEKDECKIKNDSDFQQIG
jgi:hypothetical protein